MVTQEAQIVEKFFFTILQTSACPRDPQGCICSPGGLGLKALAILSLRSHRHFQGQPKRFLVDIGIGAKPKAIEAIFAPSPSRPGQVLGRAIVSIPPSLALIADAFHGCTNDLTDFATLLASPIGFLFGRFDENPRVLPQIHAADSSAGKAAVIVGGKLKDALARVDRIAERL